MSCPVCAFAERWVSALSRNQTPEKLPTRDCERACDHAPRMWISDYHPSHSLYTPYSHSLVVVPSPLGARECPRAVALGARVWVRGSRGLGYQPRPPPAKRRRRRPSVRLLARRHVRLVVLVLEPRAQHLVRRGRLELRDHVTAPSDGEVVEARALIPARVLECLCARARVERQMV